MKFILFILPLCLFTTFSTKRAGNLHQLISSKVGVHLQITDEEEARNNIRRHPVKLDNIFMLTLMYDDSSGFLKSRHLLSGIPGSFYVIATNKRAPIHTENYYTDIYTDMPSRLFNKGSPEIKNIRINYCSSNFKNVDCLFRFLHQYYSLPTPISKTSSSLLICLQYPAIIQLQPFFLSEETLLHVPKKYTIYKKRLDVLSDLTVFKKIRPPP